MPSSRRRLGVALLLDEPVRSEIEGLRRAVGDPSLGRMVPHVTLVPPVNVHPRDLPAALSRLRSAASSQRRPIVATLGPPATFLPANPVLYLEVGGDIERIAKLRDDVFGPPLARTLTWPWIPHVTLGDGVAEDRIRAALTAMGGYAALATFERVVLLEELRGRIWAPIADACLEPAAVVGTGGMALTITRGRTLDPEAVAALGASEGARVPVGVPGADDATRPPLFSPPIVSPPIVSPPIVLTGRTDDGVAGCAAAWVDASGAHAGVLVAEACRGRGVGGHLLAHLESAARAAGWEFPALQAEGPAGFYRSRSAWARPDAGAAPATRTPPRNTGRAS
jgi:2'-5' RNA ligase